MSPIRTYRDAWHGAVHLFHPRTAAGCRSLRAPEARPAAPATSPPREPAAVRNWLDGRRP